MSEFKRGQAPEPRKRIISIENKETWSGADLYDSNSFDKSQNQDELTFMRMISNESREEDIKAASQKHSFDFIQGVPLTTSGSKEKNTFKWESISEVSENLESDAMKA